jgi:myosin heavy subunit
LECRAPGASDERLVASLDKLAKNRKYIPSRFGQSFTVEHYAGAVEYTTQGWLETNRDPVSEGLVALLAGSSNPSVASMFTDTWSSPEPSGGGGSLRGGGGQRRGFKSGAFRTVSQRHREQLASLMRQLRSTEPHFVRCIVPNSAKVPSQFDVFLVLEQLRCNGVVEGIRISRLGFPNRTSFADFVERYSCLDPNATSIATLPPTREGCKALVRALNLDPSAVKVGVSKVFLKAGILADLDSRRETFLASIFVGLQAMARRLLVARAYEEQRRRWRAAVAIQRGFRELQRIRRSPWTPLMASVMSRLSEEGSTKRTTTVSKTVGDGAAAPHQNGNGEHHHHQPGQPDAETVVPKRPPRRTTALSSRKGDEHAAAELEALMVELAAAREREAQLTAENKKLRQVCASSIPCCSLDCPADKLRNRTLTHSRRGATRSHSCTPMHRPNFKLLGTKRPASSESRRRRRPTRSVCASSSGIWQTSGTGRTKPSNVTRHSSWR